MRVGIVITAYNSTDNLPRAVAAAFAQTCSNLVVTVIDDHSTHDIFGLLKEFRDRKNFKFLRLDRNVGPADARNFGILLSGSSAALTFHDHDDMPLPEKVERQIAALNRTKEIDYIRAATIVKNASFATEVVVNRVLRRERDGTEQIAGEMIYLLRDIYPNTYGNFGTSGRKYSLHTVSSLFRKTVFYKLGGFYPSLYHYEDNELAARLILANVNFHFLSDVLYEFDKNDDSLTYQPTEKYDSSVIDIFRRISRMRNDSAQMSSDDFASVYRVKIDSSARFEYAHNFDKHDFDGMIPASEELRRDVLAKL